MASPAKRKQPASSPSRRRPQPALAVESSACRSDRRDALGRLLVYATPEPNGRDLGGELIFQGYAWADRDVPFVRYEEYVRYEEDAWRAGRGIWQRGEKLESGSESVVTGRHAHCYHSPGCQHAKYMANVMTLTLSDARARRLVPCSEFRGKK
ncbi:MAG: thermonuclease family protein [Planctomycetes bacterium]|nr:thermonuclease family protein [Planctomycetota bacterium]